MSKELLELLSAREGHFKLESGHHGSLWFDLDQLFLQPSRVRPYMLQLAERLSKYNIVVICGPLIGGALIAQMIAIELNVEFYYTVRVKQPHGDALYSVEYPLPNSLREKVGGKKFGIVDDVINAGSAVRGTLAKLKLYGAKPAVIGTLLVLGSTAPVFLTDQNIPLESIAHLPNDLWIPSECPLCATQTPLEDLTSEVK